MKVERERIVDDPTLVGARLRSTLVRAADAFLSGLLDEPGSALVAVGGYGRGELSPGSDLDVLLLHDDGRSGVQATAGRLWYPVWDCGVALDHSVRTVSQAVEVADGDLKVALGLLDARHVAGDPTLTGSLVARSREAWRRSAPKRLPQLHQAGLDRAAAFGEVAFLLEPDLKHARGGLRDAHALRALAMAQVADPPRPQTARALEVLLDVRGELHRRTLGAGRTVVDRLLLQEQDAVAAALGYLDAAGRPDADGLMIAVSDAARTIAYEGDATWRRVLPAPAGRRSWGLVARRRGPERTPLADGVVSQGGEAVLARGVAPEQDALLPLRLAAAAAWAGLPVAPSTAERLARRCPPLPEPWPDAARDALVRLLSAGQPAVGVLEAYDQAGLLAPLLPEWAHVRSRPQRNSVHRFTVDRHLLETAAGAAALTRRVARPDLLLLAGLLHDLGKGYDGQDHSQKGAELVAVIGPRLGLDAADTDVLVTLVRHHLLLPDVATRRDLDDPATIRHVADRVGDRETLALLHALTEADAGATGPTAWSCWKAALVDGLVTRTAALLGGVPLPPPGPLAPWQQQLVEAGMLDLAARDDEVTVVAPDRPGLLALATGVIALHRLDVRSASVRTVGSVAVVVLRVAPRFGALPDWKLVRDDLRRADRGELWLGSTLRSREQAYARPGSPAAPATVRLLEEAGRTVVEVRAADQIGVLHRITTALLSCGLDVPSAHCSSLGADVVDAFYVVGPAGAPLAVPDREPVRQAVLDALRHGGEQTPL